MINSTYKPSIIRNNRFYKDQINIMGWHNISIQNDSENIEKDTVIDELDQQVQNIL